MPEPCREPSVDRPVRAAYDAVVVGSGFGGSVATYRLSHADLEVCLLERGRCYPPGSFARGVAEAKDNFWSPGTNTFGLYDIWSFRRMFALVSAGLGGGSLIYANVLLRMPEPWFDGWPLRYDDLEKHYEAVETMLGATRYPQALHSRTPKTEAFLQGTRGAGLSPFFPKLAITFAPPGQEGEQFDNGTGNLHGAPRYRCRLVGDCDAGCNFGAKNTLDLTYLSQLKRGMVDIRTLCEATLVESSDDGWRVHYADHRHGGTSVVTAPRVVVAAGALGSTYLLLRSRAADALGERPPGDALGRRFSGNGDLLTFALGVREVVDPAVGPVITAAAQACDMFIQDGGGPTVVWWLAQMLEAPRTAWRFFPRLLRLVGKAVSCRPETELGAEASALLGDARLAAHSLPLLGMGRDLPNGRFVLKGSALDLRWERGDRRAYYRRAHDVSRRVADALDARVDDLAFRFNHYVTVHPLGGCPMSESPADGVVDPWGQVHGCEGLYVLDGSAMPGPVGANPSLTIAAFADRAAQHMVGAS